MLKSAGRGVTIANAHPATKKAASDIMEEAYGKGFVQATKKYQDLPSGKVTVNDNVVLDVFYRLKGDDQQVAVFQGVTVSDKRLVRVYYQIENLPGIEINPDVLERSDKLAIVAHDLFSREAAGKCSSHEKNDDVLIFKVF